MPPSIFKNQSHVNPGLEEVEVSPNLHEIQRFQAMKVANASSNDSFKVDMNGGNPNVIERPSLGPRARSSSANIVGTNSPVRTEKKTPMSLPRAQHTRSRSMTLSGMPRASAQTSLKKLETKLAFRRSRYGDKHHSVGILWNRIGNEYFRACQYQSAMDAYKQAVQCDAGEQLGAAYANIGTVYWAMGEVKKSISFIRQALDVYELDEISEGRNADESIKVANTQYQLGLALTLDGELEEALDVLKKVQRVQENLHGKSSLPVARTWDAIGKVRYFQGDLSKALKCHDKALCIKEFIADEPCAVVPSLLNIAAAHSMGENLKESLVMYERALNLQKAELIRCKREKLREQVRAATEVGETLQLMGDASILIGDQREAQRYFKEALLVYREAGIKDDDPRVAVLLQL